MKNVLETTCNPRDLAVMALRDRTGNISAHLARLVEIRRHDRTDAAFARELALGTLRRKGTINAVLQVFLAQPDRRIPAPVSDILSVALYQLIFLDRVPDFALVNEAVEQAERFNHKRQAGFVNGVLRTVARNISECLHGTVPLASDVIPVAAGRYRKLTKPAFADPTAKPAEYLAGAFSLPEALTGRWIHRFGSLEKVFPLAMHANVRAPLIVRVNELKADIAGVLAGLKADGVDATPYSNGISCVLSGGMDLTELEVFREGWIQPQDPTATAVGLAAAPEAGQNVLDFCAAPGTKTTHLAELMSNRGSIVALDVSQEKLDRIESNCQRMGISIVHTVLAELAGQLELKSFDCVLVDAPCSNTGVLSRRPEARWRFDKDALSLLSADQESLVRLAAGFVCPGGRLVYSTCSIEPEECSQIARQIERFPAGLHLIREKLTLPAGAEEPTLWHDGGYCAVFKAD